MALIKITNGEVTNIVTRGAFDKQFKHLGFWPVDDEVVEEVKHMKAPKKVEAPVESEPEVDADGEEDIDTEEDADAFVDELLEKPISQWNKQEVKDFAAAKGIDLKGTKNASEAKEIIKKYLEDIAKNEAEA